MLERYVYKEGMSDEFYQINLEARWLHFSQSQ